MPTTVLGRIELKNPKILDSVWKWAYSAKIHMGYLSTIDGLLVRKSGEWAERKHHYLNNYCGITTVSMRKKFKLVYVDVMAGPGRCKIEKTNEEFPGSPLVALNHDFAEYIFIEENPELADALKKRIANHPKAGKVTVLTENWIKVVEDRRLKFNNSTLAIVFVDPIGISEVPMSAMKKLARNIRIDLLVTIQYRLGIVRNLPQYLNASSNQTALDNFLGGPGWREWKTGDFGEFGRRAVEYFCEKFQTDEGFIGTQHVSVPEQNPLYRFTLFTRHPRGEDFWNKILKIDEKGQRDLPL